MLAAAAIFASAALAQSEAGRSPAQIAASVRPNINYAALSKLGWQLSCQAYTFREMSLFETIDVLNALGIRYIELFPGQRFSPTNPAGFSHDSSPEMVNELMAKLKSANVKPVAYGVVGLGNDEAAARKVFDFAKKLGITTITSEPPEDAMPMLDKLCQEYKINIAIHNHPRPSHYWSPDTVLKAVAGTSKRIGACADTGHWYRSNLVPLDCIKELKGRIVSLHFKDLNSNKEDVPWGTGVCNTNGMLNELKAQGFKGPFSIEYERTSGAELISNVAKCCAYFSEAATKLAAGKKL
jgi:sugar phosphate isomerase/epimerase